MSSSCSPSDRAPEILESVSLLQYLTNNIENESLPIETRYNLLLELILTLENAADNMKYFQGEQVFESLTLYTEASKYKEQLWKLESELKSMESIYDTENSLRPHRENVEDTDYPIFKKAMPTLEAGSQSLDNISSEILRNILKRSCLAGFPRTNRNTAYHNSDADEPKMNLDTNEKQRNSLAYSSTTQKGTEIEQTEQQSEAINTTSHPPNQNTFQRASEWLAVNKNKTNNNGNNAMRKQSLKKKGFQVPRRLDDDNNPTQAKEDDSQLPQIPNIEPRLVELITNEVLERNPGVGWNDIAGLEFPKSCVLEAVVWPMMRPDIFSGIRRPPKGLLLFGPPGTGKTMIGRAIASRAGATFFNISASSLTSKWVGESEKMVRALFGVARFNQPAVIFIDEIDSLLTQRSESDQESSRRLKTEFLVQMDGAASTDDDRILVVGATNRPQELDEAARRRLIKRLYIPLPDSQARKCLISRLLHSQKHSLTEEQLDILTEKTQGYSGSDLRALCAEAAMGPLRELGEQLENISLDGVRSIEYADFVSALRLVRASVATADLEIYKVWNDQYGSFPMQENLTTENS